MKTGAKNILKFDAPQSSPRLRDADLTKADILRIAMEEFALQGLAGARVDAIAARTQTTKRMIYYYFGSKEGLYGAVLEQAYAKIRELEENLLLDTLDPETALRRLVEFSFDYHEAHPEFIRLVMIENIHGAAHLKSSQKMRETNSPAISILARLLKRGCDAGIFKRVIGPEELHMMISALCFYRVSNRASFAALNNINLGEPRVREQHRRTISDAILQLMMAPA